MTRSLKIPDEIREGFASQFDLELLKYTDQEVHALWRVQEKDLNPAGIVHGGASFSVADGMCATLGFPILHVLTKSVHFYYNRPLVLGEVDIHCRFSKKGSFTSLMEAELIQDGKLCMKGFFDMAKMKEVPEWQLTDA